MRKNLYIVLVVITLGLLGSIFLFSKEPKQKVPAYKDRQGSIAMAGEWLNAKKAIEGLVATIEQNPENNKARLNLAQAYIQEGRTTGDHGYYDKAAIELLDEVIKNEPANFEAICCKATVLLSQHHFSEGLQLANSALVINPSSAFIYGILCDANLELGNYEEAIKMADKMNSVRPDIRSYARISYLREIYGDVPGAISAIKLAVAAGYPGLEQSEWTRCVLAHLYESRGDLDSAEYEYNIALRNRPNYAFAIAGLGKIAKAKGNYKEAIQYFEKAKDMIIEFSFSDELSDLYRLDNQTEKANKNAEAVVELLGPNAGDESDTGHGHYADKELAYAYIKTNQLEKALTHAQTEYQRRPNNIDVCETLAWVHYKLNDFKKANEIINKALKTKCKNPILLCRAGLIKLKVNDSEQGRILIKQALEINPFLDIDLKNEALAYIK
jgi:tetratricopeptide (TPR) repeat protein